MGRIFEIHKLTSYVGYLALCYTAVYIYKYIYISTRTYAMGVCVCVCLCVMLSMC